jgi:hypothetical protein
MPSTKIDRRAGAVGAAARRDRALIARAAKRTDLAGTVLESAAADLNDAHGEDGNTLTGLAEVVLEQAGRISHLAEDIDSHRVPGLSAELAEPRG